MHQIPRSWKGRYGAALLMVGSGTLGVGVLIALIGLPIFVLCSVSIAKTTCTGGPGAGLVAAVLALLVSNYLFLPPYFRSSSWPRWAGAFLWRAPRAGSGSPSKWGP